MSTAAVSATVLPPTRRLKSSIPRYAAGFGLIAAVSVVGMPLALLLLPSRTLRIKLTNVLGKITGSAVTWMSGARTTFVNREGINDHFPAIYVMNHTSTLDMFLAIWLCPIGGCGVTKKEITKVPFLGQLYKLSGHLLLDRGDKTQSVGELTAAAELMKKHRLACWILPEGTRSRDGKLRPFKTGFVHLAIATGLPVVPVVVHGADRIWPKGFTFHKGELPIEVLPPIDTSGWSAETSKEHAQAVHDLVAETLARRRPPAPTDSASASASAGAS
ncbi:MAG TPA: lysophospholipid acyltransferase family protein [Polyangiaceae bacterium]|nr:lysophospholipid acyltransferase family protein [Polyangiaceae bacterium]